MERSQYLAKMGITEWVPRDQAAVDDGPVPTPKGEAAAPVAAALASGPVPTLGFPELTQRVASCERCTLSKTRKQTVFGIGNRNADWMFVGEAPGADEDHQGEPFVGRAGHLLNAILFSIGLSREDVFIANILKCRPPNNRDPRPDEIASCLPYLRRQIELIEPKIIVALGRFAAHNLLAVETPLGRLRGKVHRAPELDLPLVVTYHPAYLLRSPREKPKVWQDLQLARVELEQG